MPRMSWNVYCRNTFTGSSNHGRHPCSRSPISRPLSRWTNASRRNLQSWAEYQGQRIRDATDHTSCSSVILPQIPTPRQASPEPTIPQNNGNYILPCPHCLAGNQWGWRCPQPIPDPENDLDTAWHADDGSPPGHGFCGNWCMVSLTSTTSGSNILLI